MKTKIGIIISCIVVGTCIIYAACERDNVNTSTIDNNWGKCAPKGTTIIGYSETENGEITLLIDKDSFLAAFEDSLNSNDGEYIVEELRIWNEEYQKDRFAPLMSISFYDIKEECGNILFIQPERINEKDGFCYAINRDSPHGRCFGGCNNPCRAILDRNGSYLMCQPCTDPMPNFSFGDRQKREGWLLLHSCSSSGTNGLISEKYFTLVLDILSLYIKK